MLEIQRTALKKFLTISLTVHGKFLDSCFLFKSSTQGERHHECIAWKVEKWYPKAGSYLYGDTAGIGWVFLFFWTNSQAGTQPIHLGENTVRGLMLVASQLEDLPPYYKQSSMLTPLVSYLSVFSGCACGHLCKKSHIKPSNMTWNPNLDLIVGVAKRSEFFSTFFFKWCVLSMSSLRTFHWLLLWSYSVYIMREFSRGGYLFLWFLW
jgi:hypothetical protein